VFAEHPFDLRFQSIERVALRRSAPKSGKAAQRRITMHTDIETRTTSDPKIRKCLLCRKPFPSAWAGERVCRKCKSTSAWRSACIDRRSISA
jgi:hypothetical protein